MQQLHENLEIRHNYHVGWRQGRKHYWGRFLREVWWFLNWLLPPQSYPALLFKWNFSKKPRMIDALPISAAQQPWGVNEARPVEVCRGAAELWGATLARHRGTSLSWHLSWALGQHGTDTPMLSLFLCSVAASVHIICCFQGIIDVKLYCSIHPR